MTHIGPSCAQPEWVKIKIMNRVQGLLVATITGLTIICVGLIVAVARSNASGGSGRPTVGNMKPVSCPRASLVQIFNIYNLILKEKNPLNNSYNPLQQVLLWEMESW